MQNSSSAKSLVVQLSSLVNYVDKIASGSATIDDIEMMSAVNNVLRDCVILQKNIKLKKIKQDILAGVESCVSNTDFQKLGAYLENIHPSINVSQERISRLIGQMNKEGKIHAESVKENIFAVFETLKKRLEEDAHEKSDLQDMTLQSAEAICEVIRRLLIQESAQIKS
jgi:hypothetical protein